MNKDMYIALAKETLVKYLGPEAARIPVRFVPRIGRVGSGTAGTASHPSTSWMVRDMNFGGYEINLSEEVFAAYRSETDCRRTTLHECAHVIAHYECAQIFWKQNPHLNVAYGFKNPGHGPYWKKVMVRLGLAPQRCYSWDAIDPTKIAGTVTYHCAKCKTVMAIKVRKAARIDKGFCRSRCCMAPLFKGVPAMPSVVSTTVKTEVVVPPPPAPVVATPIVAPAVTTPAATVHTCPKCQKSKSYAEFGERRCKGPGGEVKVRRQSYCRDCR